jgi:hypothetical protein
MASGRRMRSKNVALALTTLAAAASLSSCSAGDDYQAICVDPQTEERVADDTCDDDTGTYVEGESDLDGFYWFYIPTSGGHRAPAVGSSYSSLKSAGVYKPPAGKSFTKGGFSSKGGSVKSGGFGSGFGSASS